MRRISSRATFWYKRVFPIAWFGSLAVLTAISVFAIGLNDRTELSPVLMAAIGYFVMKKLVFDLVDEVWDDGAALIVRDKGREDRIALSNIVNVRYWWWWLVKPPRVTLMLRQPSNFGSKISFGAPVRFIPFAKSPVIKDLILRVDAARRK